MSTRDAVIGDGVYLTSMLPKNGMEKIKTNFNDTFDGTSIQLRKVKHYFRFNSSKLAGVEKQKTKRNIWLYRYDINLNVVSFEFVETEKAQDVITSYDGSGQPSKISLA
jgi:hypothetical protein